ncbi:MAG: DUF4271 domain-containing protein [Cyclobacteriaceae bacterium]|nr:DUF4271 domain-containing protein [Cyclobacteriaceae bacterium]
MLNFVGKAYGIRDIFRRRICPSLNGQCMQVKLGNRSRLILGILFFGISHLGFSQVLENYDGSWISKSSGSWFGPSTEKEVKIPIATFPESFVYFHIPKNSTLFIDGKLWGLFLQDSLFYLPSGTLRKEFEKDTLTVTLVSEAQIQQNSAPSITKIASPPVATIQESKGALALWQERLLTQPIKDFFVISLVVILSLIAVYRIAYPYLLGVLLQPLAVIKAEDFSESGGLQKVFSLDILFFLFIVSLMLSQCLITGSLIFNPEWVRGRIEPHFTSLVGAWLLGAGIILLLTVVKFVILKVMSYLFELGKAEFAHFFYLLRLISFGCAVLMAVSSFFVLNDFTALKSIFTLLVLGFFWVYMLGVLGLFLLMMNRLDVKKYHLFTYLCIAEIVPFLILSKWILVLGQ